MGLFWARGNSPSLPLPLPSPLFDLSFPWNSHLSPYQSLSRFLTHGREQAPWFYNKMRGNGPPFSSFTWKAASAAVLLHIAACDPLSLSHTRCTLSHSLTHTQAHASLLVSLSHTCTYFFVFSFSLFPSCSTLSLSFCGLMPLPKQDKSPIYKLNL